MTSERFRTQGENMEDCIEKLYGTFAKSELSFEEVL